MAKIVALTLMAVALAASAAAADTAHPRAFRRSAAAQEATLASAVATASFHHTSGLARLFGAQQSTCVSQCTIGCEQQCAQAGCDPASCPAACETGCASQAGGSSSTTTPAPTVSRCTAAATSAEATAIQTQCGAAGFNFDAVFDLSNNTAEARAAVNSFCSSGCQSAYSAAVSAYSECFDATTRAALSALTSMCVRHEGEYCAWQLRPVAKLNACDMHMNNETACRANTDPGCMWAENRCEIVTTPAMLEATCTPCFDRYIFLVSEIMRVSAGTSETAVAAAARAQRTLVNQKELVCSRVGSTWCLPLVESVDDRVFSFDPRNNMTIAAIETNVSNMCNSTGKRCLNKVFGVYVSITADTVEAQYESCIRARTQTFNGRSFVSSTNQEYCLELVARAYTEINGVSASLSLVCGANAAGEQCGPKIHNFVRHGCYTPVAAGARLASAAAVSTSSVSFNLTATAAVSCNATCATWMNTAIAGFGCCWEHVRAFQIATAYPSGVGLPRFLEERFQAARNNTDLTGVNRATTPIFAEVQLCNASAAATGFDTSAALSYLSSTCVRPEAVRKELPLTGMRWSQLEANATLRARLTAALTADVARSLGVASSAIVNATLAADASQQLTTGANATRRQTASSTAGTKFEFAISGDSAAEVEQNAAAFESAKSSNSIAVTTTAEVVSSDCSDCVGSPTAAPGQTAAPPPTGALFASLVGADTSGTQAPPTVSSSAASSAAAVATVLAAVAAAAAL